MNYLFLLIGCLCLITHSKVESVKELLEQTKEQYHLVEDINELRSMFETELGMKKEKENNKQDELQKKDDSIFQSIQLNKVNKSGYNISDMISPNSTYNQTQQQYKTNNPIYSNTSNISNITNNTNGSYPYNNSTYNYTYPSSLNISSNSSTYNTTNQTSSLNYTNGSIYTNNTRNNRLKQSKLQLKFRNNLNLGQGLVKNNTQNVTFYNTSSGTYEYVVIYNNSEVYQNQTDSYYFYFQNNTLITLEREYDSYGNIIYRNFNLTHSLIVAGNSSNTNFNNQQQAFGTLILTNHTFQGQYNQQEQNSGYLYQNETNNYNSYNQNNQNNGQAQYSNQTGGYQLSSSGNGGTSSYSQNGSQSNSDYQNYNNNRYTYGYIDTNQSTSSRYSNNYSGNTDQFQSVNSIQGNNTSVFQNQNLYTNNQVSQSTYVTRGNGTTSNMQSISNSSTQAESNSTNFNRESYSAGTTNSHNTYLDTTFSNQSSNNSDYLQVNYNYNVTDTNANYINNSTNYAGNTNTTSLNLSGNQQANNYTYDNSTFSYTYGNNQATLNDTLSEFTSTPNTTVTTINQYITTANSNNYITEDEPALISGQNQTSHTQSTIEQQTTQFNQLRGSKKQTSGSWKQIQVEELQSSNSIILDQAINEIKTKFNPEEFGYHFDSIISVQEQIVSGINYKIYLSYSNAEQEQQVYEVIIYSIPWQNKPNQVFKSIRFDQFEN
ncbi:unnamed protein product [Paramecium sonneborni]|uniref:Uncharacterized protein n=1 Tax=Paramecium sonneborni TaxID=65129 RepID=A0A8S1MGG9_9CILI|nr:unnamed protein product [Paramecium sonneborni]